MSAEVHITCVASATPASSSAASAAIRALGDVYLDPRSAVAVLGMRWAWVAPWLVVGTCQILLGLAMLPITLAVARHALANTGSQQALLELGRIARLSQIGAALAPLVLLLEWLVAAGVVFVGVVLLDIRVSGRTVFNLIAYCSLIPLLGNLVSYLIVYIRVHIQHAGLTSAPALGLGLLISPHNLLAGALVSYFSIFTVWYFAVLALLLCWSAGCGKLKPVLATAPLWLLGAALSVARCYHPLPGGRQRAVVRREVATPGFLATAGLHAITISEPAVEEIMLELV